MRQITAEQAELATPGVEAVESRLPKAEVGESISDRGLPADIDPDAVSFLQAP